MPTLHPKYPTGGTIPPWLWVMKESSSCHNLILLTLNIDRSTSHGTQQVTVRHWYQNVTHYQIIKMLQFLVLLINFVGTFSVLQVIFLLQRHTGYFLIQVFRVQNTWISYSKLNAIMSREFITFSLQKTPTPVVC